MRDEINKVYDVFKFIVVHNSNHVLENDFVDFIKKDELSAECTEDNELLKLSVLSSHQEWEGVYRVEHDSINDCIGEVCIDLQEKGLNYFKISPYELGLLREEVVYGNTKYSVYINSVKELQETYNKNPSDVLCRYLIVDSLVLHRVDQVRIYLEEFKSFTGNVLLNFELPIYIARLYDEVIGYDEDLFIDKELETALELFEKYQDMNRRLRIVDPTIFTIYYIKTIEQYLYYLSLEDDQNSNNQYTIFYDQPRDRTKREFGDARYYFLEELDEEFVFKADKKVVNLIEKHDDLLLSLLPYVDNIDSININPIFKGTKSLIWKYYLNKTFPEKLDYFLTYDDPPHPIIKTPLDIKKEQLKEMLIKEFKAKDDVKSINECFEDY